MERSHGRLSHRAEASCTVEIKALVTQEMANDVQEIAKERDITVGALVRTALTEFIEQGRASTKNSGAERLPSDPAPRPEPEREWLKATVARAVQAARDWQQLQENLGIENIEIAPKGGGLTIRWADTKEDICKASDAGFGYSKLIRKFGSGFPGHSHQWLADRIVGEEFDEVIED